MHAGRNPAPAIICFVALWAAPVSAQQTGTPARAVVNDVSVQAGSPPVVVGDEAYADVEFLTGALGMVASADAATASVSVSFFGRQLVLTHGQPPAAGLPPVQLLQSQGHLLVPLRPLAEAFGLAVAIEAGPTVRVTCARPAVVRVAYNEGDDMLRVVVELTSPALFDSRWIGTDVILTLPTNQPFVPPNMLSLRHDMRGHEQPVTAPTSLQYELAGPLGKLVQVANLTGPSLRVGVMNRYTVPDARLYTLDDPPRIVLDFTKAYSTTESQHVAPGIEYRLLRMGKGWGPVVAHCVVADLSAGPYRVAVLPAGAVSSARQPLSRIAEAHSALVACNGGYFDPQNGHPLGLLVQDSEWIRLPIMNRTSLLVLQSGQLTIGNVSATGSVQLPSGRVASLTGLNQWLPTDGTDALIVHTPRWGQTYAGKASTHAVIAGGKVQRVVDVTGAGDVTIPRDGLLLSASGAARDVLRALSPGQQVGIQLALSPPVPGVRDALGAGPRLVHQGRPWCTQVYESFRPDVTSARSPRAALGLTADGRVVLVVVDGRAPGYSGGMYLEELADLMISLGAVEAMSFDSGGSAEMTLGSRVANVPSDGRERPVPNAIAIVRR